MTCLSADVDVHRQKPTDAVVVGVHYTLSSRLSGRKALLYPILSSIALQADCLNSLQTSLNLSCLFFPIADKGWLEDASSSGSRNISSSGPAATVNRCGQQSPAAVMPADCQHRQQLFGGGALVNHNFNQHHQQMSPAASQAPHQYYYTPCPPPPHPPLTPPPSYHSEADSAELVIDAALAASPTSASRLATPKFAREDVVECGGGKASAGNKRRLSPIRGKWCHTHKHTL